MFGDGAAEVAHSAPFGPQDLKRKLSDHRPLTVLIRSRIDVSPS